MGLATIDPHSQKEHTEIHKIPKFGVNQTKVRICPHFHTFVCNFFTFLNACITVKTTIMDKSLGTNLHLWRFSHVPTARREFIYVCSAPPPPPPPPSTMLDTCTHYFSRGSTLYGGEGGKERILKRKTVLFENFVFNTQKINVITQVSQRILSTIV